MDTLRDTALCICCGAVGLMLTTETLTAERFRRQLRLIAVLFLLIAALTQLHAVNLSDFAVQYETANTASAEISGHAEAIREQAVSEALCRSLNRALTEHNVPCTVTEVQLHIAEDGSIYIDQACIRGSTITGAVYLREWLGPDTEIRREDEQE